MMGSFRRRFLFLIVSALACLFLLPFSLACVSPSSSTTKHSHSTPWFSSLLHGDNSFERAKSVDQLGLDIRHETIGGPAIPHNLTDWRLWLSSMHLYRNLTLSALNYSSINYQSPASQWMRRSFIQPQAMIHDRFLYSLDEGYTVDKYLADVEERYGGIDSVLLWHSYPNIGVDARNQFDMLRSLPAYPEGVRAMIARFHEKGVKVLIPFNPWDTGTNVSRPSQMEELIDAIALIDGDGFNGDTMTGIPQSFFLYARQKYNLTLMLQAEVGLSDKPDAAELHWQMASWGYWDADPTLISKYKWLEHRHTINICNRWASNHQIDQQQAWLNGIGFESWEDVWSIWNQLSPRDAQATKQIATMSRFLWQTLSEADVILPHYPTKQNSIYSSFFHHHTSNISVFTLINTGGKNLTGEQLTVQYDTSHTFIDCYHGTILNPQSVLLDREESINGVEGVEASILSIDVEAAGFGCVAVLPSSNVQKEWKVFMERMQEFTAAPLSSYSRHQDWLQQTHRPVIRTSPASSPPPNMTFIEGADNWIFNVSGVEIEGGDGEGVDVQYSLFGETVPHRHHSLLLNISSFWVDTTSVTRAQYFEYLLKSGYQPKDPTNYLKQWEYNRPYKIWYYPPQTGDLPVTWVTREEAVAYCTFNSKRLIEEWEWQFVAQNGKNYSQFPFNTAFNASLIPPTTSSPTPLDPASVNAYPLSASLSGVNDLIGNKWEWTTEFVDIHSRRGVLRGGSRYRADGSMWYFPQAMEGGQHGLYLMMGEGMDRSQFIGFRCVKDVDIKEQQVTRRVMEE